MSEGYYVPAMSKIDLLKSARSLRQSLGMTNVLFFDVVRVIEILCNLDMFNLLIVDDDELEGAYACYNPKTNELKIRNSVYISAYNGNKRHRFTLAHEIAHWYIHSDKVAYARSSADEIPIYCNSEWQANTFASMLLMDPALIKNMPIERIVSECNVSYEAANIAKNKKLN